MNNPTCKTCPYWERYAPDAAGHPHSWGQCLRHPPQVIPQMSCWPETTEDEWCGEHPGFKIYVMSRAALEHKDTTP